MEQDEEWLHRSMLHFFSQVCADLALNLSMDAATRAKHRFPITPHTLRT